MRPVLKNELKLAPPLPVPLTFAAFLDFYIPLALTSLLNLLVQPIGSAAVSRMPRPIESLAAWSVVSGLIFMLRSPGIAFNEVVVALLDRPRSSASLWRFAVILIADFQPAALADHRHPPGLDVVLGGLRAQL